MRAPLIGIGFAVVGVLLWSGALPARADDDGWVCRSESPRVTLEEALAGSAEVVDCGENQMSMNYCARQEFYAAERDLAAQVAQASRSGADPRRFEDAQLSWCRYREMVCAAEADQYAGGTMMGHVYHACLTAFDRQRLGVVTHYLTCGQDCAGSLEKLDFQYSFPR